MPCLRDAIYTKTQTIAECAIWPDCTKPFLYEMYIIMKQAQMQSNLFKRQFF